MLVSFQLHLCTSTSLTTKNCESHMPPLGGIRVNAPISTPSSADLMIEYPPVKLSRKVRPLTPRPGPANPPPRHYPAHTADSH
jgi:hypothetical protein